MKRLRKKGEFSRFGEFANFSNNSRSRYSRRLRFSGNRPNLRVITAVDPTEKEADSANPYIWVSSTSNAELPFNRKEAMGIRRSQRNVDSKERRVSNSYRGEKFSMKQRNQGNHQKLISNSYRGEELSMRQRNQGNQRKLGMAINQGIKVRKYGAIRQNKYEEKGRIKIYEGQPSGKFKRNRTKKHGGMSSRSREGDFFKEWENVSDTCIEEMHSFKDFEVAGEELFQMEVIGDSPEESTFPIGLHVCKPKYCKKYKPLNFFKPKYFMISESRHVVTCASTRETQGSSTDVQAIGDGSESTFAAERQLDECAGKDKEETSGEKHDSSKGPEFFQGRVRIQDDLDRCKLPLLGLEYIVEVWSTSQFDKSTLENYRCLLCYQVLKEYEVIQHVVTVSHKYAYLTKHFPSRSTVFSRFPPEKFNSRSKAEFEKCYKEVHSACGRLLPHITTKDFLKHKTEDLNVVLKNMSHYGDSDLEKARESQVYDELSDVSSPSDLSSDFRKGHVVCSSTDIVNSLIEEIIQQVTGGYQTRRSVNYKTKGVKSRSSVEDRYISKMRAISQRIRYRNDRHVREDKSSHDRWTRKVGNRDKLRSHSDAKVKKACAHGKMHPDKCVPFPSRNEDSPTIHEENRDSRHSEIKHHIRRHRNEKELRKGSMEASKEIKVNKIEDKRDVYHTDALEESRKFILNRNKTSKDVSNKYISSKEHENLTIHKYSNNPVKRNSRSKNISTSLRLDVTSEISLTDYHPSKKLSVHPKRENVLKKRTHSSFGQKYENQSELPRKHFRMRHSRTRNSGRLSRNESMSPCRFPRISSPLRSHEIRSRVSQKLVRRRSRSPLRPNSRRSRSPFTLSRERNTSPLNVFAEREMSPFNPVRSRPKSHRKHETAFRMSPYDWGKYSRDDSSRSHSRVTLSPVSVSDEDIFVDHLRNTSRNSFTESLPERNVYPNNPVQPQWNEHQHKFAPTPILSTSYPLPHSAPSPYFGTQPYGVPNQVFPPPPQFGNPFAPPPMQWNQGPPVGVPPPIPQPVPPPPMYPVMYPQQSMFANHLGLSGNSRTNTIPGLGEPFGDFVSDVLHSAHLNSQSIFPNEKMFEEMRNTVTKLFGSTSESEMHHGITHNQDKFKDGKKKNPIMNEAALILNSRNEYSRPVANTGPPKNKNIEVKGGEPSAENKEKQTLAERYTSIFSNQGNSQLANTSASGNANANQAVLILNSRSGYSSPVQKTGLSKNIDLKSGEPEMPNKEKLSLAQRLASVLVKLGMLDVPAPVLSEMLSKIGTFSKSFPFQDISESQIIALLRKHGYIN